MTYTATIDKLNRLFSTLTDRQQIPVAQRHAHRLVARVQVPHSSGGDCWDMDGWFIENQLLKVIYRLIREASIRLPTAGI